MFIHKIWLRIPVAFQLETKTRLKMFWIILKAEVSFLGSLWKPYEVAQEELNCWMQTYSVAERIQLGQCWLWNMHLSVVLMELCPGLLVVFLFWKTKKRYRFTNQASFHLNCTFLGTTFAVWFHHRENKAPALDSDCSKLKCNCMIFCPPAWKNISYISRSSNTPSEGAVVKKTAQVNFGMCNYKEKSTICVSGTSCLCG